MFVYNVLKDKGVRVGLKDFRHSSVSWSVGVKDCSIGVNECTVVGLTANL